jgi:hypothetical protein
MAHRHSPAETVAKRKDRLKASGGWVLFWKTRDKLKKEHGIGQSEASELVRIYFEAGTGPSVGQGDAESLSKYIAERCKAGFAPDPPKIILEPEEPPDPQPLAGPDVEVDPDVVEEAFEKPIDVLPARERGTGDPARGVASGNSDLPVARKPRRDPEPIASEFKEFPAVDPKIAKAYSHLVEAAEGKACSITQEILWVNANLLREPENIPAETVPSPGAVSTLAFAQQNQQTRHNFTTQMLTKVITKERMIDQEDTLTEDGRTVDELLSDLRRRLLTPGDAGLEVFTPTSASDALAFLLGDSAEG